MVGIGLAGFAFAALVLAAPSTPVVLAGVVVAGVSLSWLVVAFVTALQLRTPLPLQGRVSSAADLLVGAPQTFSIAFGAALSTVVDYRLLLAAIAAVCGGAGGWLASRPREGTVAETVSPVERAPEGHPEAPRRARA
jgi:MFS family permease